MKSAICFTINGTEHRIVIGVPGVERYIKDGWGDGAWIRANTHPNRGAIIERAYALNPERRRSDSGTKEGVDFGEVHGDPSTWIIHPTIGPHAAPLNDVLDAAAKAFNILKGLGTDSPQAATVPSDDILEIVDALDDSDRLEREIVNNDGVRLVVYMRQFPNHSFAKLRRLLGLGYAKLGAAQKYAVGRSWIERDDVRGNGHYKLSAKGLAFLRDAIDLAKRENS